MLYFVIPTINGEIDGFPTIYTNVNKMNSDVKYECVIYKIDIFNQLITEIDN